MSPARLRIVPMRRPHIKACDGIVAASEPWKTLREGIDFARAVSRGRAGNKAYVSMKGTKTAGFVLFNPEPVFARGGYLRAIGVSQEYRRQGIGQAMLAFAERLTARRSQYLYLCVSSFNLRAQRFYRECGYTRVGKLPGLAMPGASEYIYWKKLRA